VSLAQLVARARSGFAALFVRRHAMLAPDILAEVTIVMGETGYIGITYSKLDPELNPTQIYGEMLRHWLATLSQLGVRLDFETEDHHVIPLVRPAHAPRE
jgi:hypothetical protein